MIHTFRTNLLFEIIQHYNFTISFKVWYKMKIHFLSILLGVAALSSCVEEYALPEDISEEYTGQIYIEGKILSGTESLVYILKTTDMNSMANDYVRDARVYVESEKGEKTEQGEYDSNGAYVIQTGTLDSEQRYKLVVEYDGNTYESAYQNLQSTPEIDEIGFTEDPIEGKVNIWVSTKGDKSSTPYYMWTFEEDYENHALLDMRQYKVVYSTSVYPDVTDAENPYYYCWSHENSHNIMIYSTDDLTENTVKEHVIADVSVDKPNLQMLYCITVHQSNISNEAYEYYSQMKSNTEDMGSIFAPMPTEVYGNITCTTDPNIKVRGFVTASNSTMKRFFINPSDLKKVKCTWVSGNAVVPPSIKDEEWLKALGIFIERGYALISETPEQIKVDDTAYYPSCINVLLTGGTKDKPEWWPNDHK